MLICWKIMIKKKSLIKFILLLIASGYCLNWLFQRKSQKKFLTGQDVIVHKPINLPIEEESAISNLNLDRASADVHDVTCMFADREDTKTDVSTGNVFRLWAKLGLENQNPRLPEKAFSDELQPLKVFVVPHSHVDPGWHKTVEDYYQAHTIYILDRVVDMLIKYKDMTFIWSEISFLKMWWDDADITMREKFKELVKSGRLEIVGGGWVMPDEATTHYYGVIDQFIEGHQWLQHDVGVTPNNSWQADPFGVSSSVAYLMNKIGFSNIVIQRFHHGLKWHLGLKQNLEFRWRQYWDHEGMTDMFCHGAPYQLYTIKWSCGPDPEICVEFDFRRINGENTESKAIPITDDNVHEKAAKLLNQYKQKAQLYRHNVVLIPVGDDFRFGIDEEWAMQHDNYVKLFNYINNHDWKANIQFGTLNDYFNEVHKREQKLQYAIPTLSGDFFPYSDKDNKYWVGYFSTRPFNKKLGRLVESRVRTADVVTSLQAMLKQPSRVPDDVILDSLQFARRNLALFQHHDAITGTSEGYVADDYGRKLWMSLYAANHALIRATQHFLIKSPALVQNLDAKNQTVLKMGERMRTDQSLLENELLEISAGKKSYIVLHNSLSIPRKDLIRLRVNNAAIEVRDEEDKMVQFQINPVWLQRFHIAENEYEVVFYADVPPFTFVTYCVALRDGIGESKRAKVKLLNSGQEGKINRARADMSGFDVNFEREPLVLHTKTWEASFSSIGLLEKIRRKNSREIINIRFGFYKYTSSLSGAYIIGELRNPETLFVGVQARPIIRVIRGSVIEEIHVVVQNLVHIVTVDSSNDDNSVIAFDFVNKVDIKNLLNEELFMRVSTDVQSHNNFFTDLNGLQVVRRERYPNLPEVANVYPATSLAGLEDEQQRLSLLLSEAHGVWSPSPGALEILLDRRMYTDDGRGLGGGVTSLLRTAQHFKLLLEPHNKNVLHANSNLIYMSPRSYSSVNQLNHPLVKMFIDPKLDTSLIKKKYELPILLPCQQELVSFRFLPHLSEKMASPVYGFISHKHAFDCSFEIPVYHKICKRRKFIDVLPDVNVKDVYKSTLTFTADKKKLDINDDFHIEPMQIEAFKIVAQ